MGSTRVNETGQWNSDAIERQLGHQEMSDVRRAYIHAAEFWAERVRLMQSWADYLDKLRQLGEVVTLGARESLMRDRLYGLSLPRGAAFLLPEN